MLGGKISVVMPAFNEAENIVKNLRETVDTLTQLGYDFEVIVVDDGSGDDTWMAATGSLLDHHSNVRVLRYDQNEGKGNAVMRGTAVATGDYIVFLDADMDLHPAQLPVLFDIMLNEDADIVIGSKLHPGSRVNYPRSRRIATTAYYGLVRRLFGLPLRDTQTGLKLFKAQVLRRVFPKVLVKRFAADIEVLVVAHSLGYKICEAPVTLVFQRRFGRIKPSDVFMIFKDTLAIFYRLKILRYYDSISEEWPAPRQPIRELVGTKSR
ncbi:MAG: glycosyltransferase [Candidatus Eremiobacteraeota bacterium]|nr:glycosyltransferase [Candidatus Eremiobacteraeota bacterium]MBV8366917.1 glycosyltransferase [Candidatus Eremiobacteraeota bacterium]